MNLKTLYPTKVRLKLGRVIPCNQLPNGIRLCGHKNGTVALGAPNRIEYKTRWGTFVRVECHTGWLFMSEHQARALYPAQAWLKLKLGRVIPCDQLPNGVRLLGQNEIVALGAPNLIEVKTRWGTFIRIECIEGCLFMSEYEASLFV